MTAAAWLWIAAILAAGLSLALGVFVLGASEPLPIDVRGEALRGRGIRAAMLFTLSGRTLPLACVAAVALALTFATRSGWKIALAIVAAQLLSQAAVELVKRFFARTRPLAWLVHEELGFSFPSGHAATGVVFYGSWAILVLHAPLATAPRLVVAATLVLWALGIMWSRMALGAHHATDVIGGALFGGAWACALWALVIANA
ncbi:MAG TPA: phosphatase PAP2 family protein [Candidatus Baltobacteraceae bacterium]|jgi:undecaprenyl-diphosphatase|nr:phosphatase PAP2 family protein [Candidatus Baltobacteraceae bacterium]